MKLRTKTLIIIGATLVSLVVILYAASRLILLGSFAKLENQHALRGVQRVLGALSSELDQLHTTAADWASWDDTYQFIEDANPEYVESNLVDSTFVELRLNLMLLVNRSGEVVFGKGLDLLSGEEAPVPRSLLDQLSTSNTLLKHADADSHVTGIVSLPEGPLLIASRPILTSEDEGPVRGTLIMGRYLDAAEIERLEETTSSSITVWRFDDPALPEDLQLMRSLPSGETPKDVRPLSEETIAGYTLLRDVYGEPALTLEVDSPREIYEQGRASVHYFIFSLVATGLVFGVVVLLLLERQVLSRLTRLSRDVAMIGASGDPSARVLTRGRDELGTLASAINGMLEALARSGEALRKARDDLEARVRDRTAELARANEALEAEIAERKQTGEESQRRSAQLEALRQVGLELTARLDLDEVLHSIVSRAIELGRWSSGGLYLHRAEQDVLEWAVAVGPNLAPPGVVLQRGEGLSGKVWETGEPVIVDDYEHWDGRATVYEDYDWTAVVGVPIRYGEEFLGVLDVLADAPHTFSPADAELLELFATQAAIAIQNVRLFQREREQRELAEALAEASAVVTGTLDLDQVLDRILEQVARVVAGDAFSIMLVEGDCARTVRRWGSEHLGPAGRATGEPVPIDRFPTLRKMVRTGKSVVVLDTTTDPNWISKRGREWRRSYVGAPIQVGGVTVGFLSVSGTRPGQFGPDDAQRLEAFAHQAAGALENAQLFQETRHHLAQTRVLHEVMLAAVSTLDFDQVLERTVKVLQATMGVEFIGFALPVEEGEGLRYHEAHIGFPATAGDSKMPLDGSICGRVFQTGEPVVVGDVTQSPDYLEGHPDVRSELAVPVRVGDRVIGVLNLESRALNGFDQDDLAFYATIAGQLGMALHNARLYEEVVLHAERLETALAQLQELDRLKNQFIQSVSHELRSPLALIRGYAELLTSGELGELSAEQRGPAEIIVRRSQMLANLVDDISLLLAAEARTLRCEPVALDELARAAVEDFRLAASQAGLTLTAQIAPGVSAIGGEPVCLRRVLDNLLSNAIKFTPAGGSVEVLVQEGDHQVVLVVKDTGIGVAPEHHERIFKRFYQVDGSSKRRYGGVGLGLALVKEIVEAHGGTVDFESEVGQGSTFTVTLSIFEGQDSEGPEGD